MRAMQKAQAAARVTKLRQEIWRLNRAYREHPEPRFLTYGPKTRREFLNLLRWNGGERA